MNADKARAIANEVTSINGPYKQAETAQILAAIKNVAEKGKYEIVIANAAYDFAVIVKRLESLGYIITVTDDQRDGWAMTISW